MVFVRNYEAGHEDDDLIINSNVLQMITTHDWERQIVFHDLNTHLSAEGNIEVNTQHTSET